MKFTIIKTPRLMLRAITPEVYAYIFSSYSESEIREFLGCQADEDYLEQRRRFEGGYATFNRSMLYFQIIEEKSNRIIGWAGFHTWYIQHDRAELGYGLTDATDRQRGYMSEAVEAIIRYGFEVMNLNRIEAMASPDNEASLRILQKNGFAREGLLRSHYRNGNHIDDSVVYGLLKSEFQHHQS